MTSAPMGSPPDLRLRYELVRELKRGGAGVVYAGRARDSGRPVAIKLLLDARSDRQQSQRLEREARALARLEHPHIARVYDFGFQNGRPAIVLELIRGRDLGVIIAEALRYQGRGLDPHRARGVLAPIADALAHAHALGIVHRDVKPENILIEEGSGRPVLIDFGLAMKRADYGEDVAGFTEGLSLSQGIYGTPAFMAPEQLAGRDSELGSLGPAADVWSLAATLLHAITGEGPHERGANETELLVKRLSLPARRLSAIAPGAPRGLDELCARALARSPGERPSMSAFADGLRDSERPSPSRPPSSAAEPAAPGALGGRLLFNPLLILGLLIIVAVLGLRAVMRRPPRPPAADPATAPKPSKDGEVLGPLCDELAAVLERGAAAEPALLRRLESVLDSGGAKTDARALLGLARARRHRSEGRAAAAESELAAALDAGLAASRARRLAAHLAAELGRPEHMARAAEGAADELGASPLLALGAMLAELEPYPESLSRDLAGFDARGEPLAGAYAAWLRAEAELRCARFVFAESEGARAAEAAGRLGIRPLELAATAVIAAARIALGRAGEAKAVIEAAGLEAELEAASPASREAAGRLLLLVNDDVIYRRLLRRSVERGSQARQLDPPATIISGLSPRVFATIRRVEALGLAAPARRRLAFFAAASGDGAGAGRQLLALAEDEHPTTIAARGLLAWGAGRSPARISAARALDVAAREARRSPTIARLQSTIALGSRRLRGPRDEVLGRLRSVASYLAALDPTDRLSWVIIRDLHRAARDEAASRRHARVAALFMPLDPEVMRLRITLGRAPAGMRLSMVDELRARRALLPGESQEGPRLRLAMLEARLAAEAGRSPRAIEAARRGLALQGNQPKLIQLLRRLRAPTSGAREAQAVYEAGQRQLIAHYNRARSGEWSGVEEGCASLRGRVPPDGRRRSEGLSRLARARRGGEVEAWIDATRSAASFGPLASLVLRELADLSEEAARRLRAEAGRSGGRGASTLVALLELVLGEPGRSRAWQPRSALAGAALLIDALRAGKLADARAWRERLQGSGLGASGFLDLVDARLLEDAGGGEEAARLRRSAERVGWSAERERKIFGPRAGP